MLSLPLLSHPIHKHKINSSCDDSKQPLQSQSQKYQEKILKVFIEFGEEFYIKFELFAKTPHKLSFDISKKKHGSEFDASSEKILKIDKDIRLCPIASILLGWDLPREIFPIHQRLQLSAITTLELESKKPTQITDRYIDIIKELPNLKALDFSKIKFNDKLLDLLIKAIFEHSQIKELCLSKSMFTKLQIENLQILSSKKKGLKLIDIEGGRFGEIYTDWHEYNVLKSKAHLDGMRETTKHALQYFYLEHKTVPKWILDFGAGTGQDTIPVLKLLENSYLLAVDGDEESLDILKNNLTSSTELQRLKCVTSPFMSMKLGHPMDLLIASFTWPYRPKEDFLPCWNKCVESIRKNGYIAGHFFGPISGEKPDPGMTYHTEEDIKMLLSVSGLELVWFKKEKEGSGFKIFGGTGKPAWGDLFHIVAKKL